MLAAKQYEQPLRSGNFRHFLFSAGGNDVLGSIGLYLKKHKDGDTDPANASKYVKPDFADKIEETIAGFKRLVGDVKEMAPPGTVLFVHGYANAIPKKDGQYLGKRLAAQGFDPVVARDLSRAVVVHMVGMFNDALRHFAATTANVVYIDMRPAMLVSDWNTDEISSEGNRLAEDCCPLRRGTRRECAGGVRASRQEAVFECRCRMGCERQIRCTSRAAPRRPCPNRARWPCHRPT